MSNVSWTSFFGVSILGQPIVDSVSLTKHLRADNISSSSGNSTNYLVIDGSLDTAWEAQHPGTATNLAWIDFELGVLVTVSHVDETTAMWPAGPVAIEVRRADQHVGGSSAAARKIGESIGDSSNGATLTVPTLEVPGSYLELRVPSNVSWTSFTNVSILGLPASQTRDLTDALNWRHIASSSGSATASLAIDSSQATAWEAGRAGHPADPVWFDIDLGRPLAVEEVAVNTAMWPARRIEIEVWSADQPMAGSVTNGRKIGHFSGYSHNGARVHIPTVETAGRYVELRVVSNISWTSLFEVSVTQARVADVEKPITLVGGFNGDTLQNLAIFYKGSGSWSIGLSNGVGLNFSK